MVIVSPATLARMAEGDGWALARAELKAEHMLVAALAERLEAGVEVEITSDSVEVLGQALAAPAGKLRGWPGALR